MLADISCLSALLLAAAFTDADILRNIYAFDIDIFDAILIAAADAIIFIRYFTRLITSLAAFRHFIFIFSATADTPTY
jgi:hypothetical protein